MRSPKSGGSAPRIGGGGRRAWPTRGRWLMAVVVRGGGLGEVRSVRTGGATAAGVAGCGRAQRAGLPGRRWGQRLGLQGERRGVGAVIDEAGGGVEGVQVGQVVLAEAGLGVAGQVAGVVGPSGEEDLGAGVG